MNKSSSCNERGPRRVVFKFMPTPSGPLHIGHAWLLFIMDALARRLRQQGHAADLVVIFDDLNAKNQDRNAESISQISSVMIEDLRLLGIPISLAVSNEERAIISEAEIERMCSIEMSQQQGPDGQSALNYLQNAWLDHLLGVTHILRGKDREPFSAIYQECYDRLAVRGPDVSFLPLLLNEEHRITASSPTNQVRHVMSDRTPDDLFCLLVDRCIEHPPTSAPPTDRAAATELLLGDAWSFVLGGPAAEREKQQYLARFVQQPKVQP